MIQILVLKNDLVLISQVEEVSTELGEPDCKLTKPYQIIVHEGNIDNITYESWPEFTEQNELMIHSDSILTIVEPNKFQLQKYQQVTAE